MKTSVVIIAHNEEKNIARCIYSILDQTTQADEIIIVVHNSTDNTLREAQSISDSRIIVDDYKGPALIVAARIRGINQTTGDIILCIDGDAFAENKWIEVMSKELEDQQISLVGSTIITIGNFFWRIASPLNKLGGFFSSNKTGYIWGASTGFRSEYKKDVLKFLEGSPVMAKTLNLTRTPDDYWVALNMQQLGKVAYTTKTKVYAQCKETSSKESLGRNKSDVANGKKMLAYFKQINDLK